jgi:hypothetical protein
MVTVGSAESSLVIVVLLGEPTNGGMALIVTMTVCSLKNR